MMMFNRLGTGQRETSRRGKAADLSLPIGQLAASLAALAGANVFIVAVVLAIGPAVANELLMWFFVCVTVLPAAVLVIMARRYVLGGLWAVLGASWCVWWRFSAHVVTLRALIKALLLVDVPVAFAAVAIFVISMWRELINPNLPAPRQPVSEFAPPFQVLAWLLSSRYRRIALANLAGDKQPPDVVRETHVQTRTLTRGPAVQDATAPLVRGVGDRETIIDWHDCGLDVDELDTFILGVLDGAPFSRSHWDKHGLSQSKLRTFFAWMEGKGFAQLRESGRGYDLTEEGREQFETYAHGEVE